MLTDDLLLRRQDMLAFLDCSNVGNAVDLGLDSERYQWLLSMFYMTYVLAEFGVLLWKIFPPHMASTIVVFGYGHEPTAAH